MNLLDSIPPVMPWIPVAREAVPLAAETIKQWGGVLRNPQLMESLGLSPETAAKLYEQGQTIEDAATAWDVKKRKEQQTRMEAFNQRFPGLMSTPTPKPPTVAAANKAPAPTTPPPTTTAPPAATPEPRPPLVKAYNPAGYEDRVRGAVSYNGQPNLQGFMGVKGNASGGAFTPSPAIPGLDASEAVLNQLSPGARAYWDERKKKDQAQRMTDAGVTLQESQAQLLAEKAKDAMLPWEEQLRRQNEKAVTLMDYIQKRIETDPKIEESVNDAIQQILQAQPDLLSDPVKMNMAKANIRRKKQQEAQDNFIKLFLMLSSAGRYSGLGDVLFNIGGATGAGGAGPLG